MIRMKIAENNSLLAELQYRLLKFGQGSMPATSDAMKAAADHIQEKWRGYANGGDLDGVERLNSPSWEYARSIKVNKLGLFQYEIYSELKLAKRIEDGIPDHDMKTTHPYGPKSRVSKKGVPYLIIPFSWGTPGGKNKPVGFKNIMPKSVYNTVKNLKKMRTLTDADNSSKKTPNAQNPSKMVGRAEYNSGYGRLKGSDFAGTIEQKTRMSGMVRLDTGKSKYFTFRIISAKSPASSWIRKGEPARPVTRALANYSQKFIETIVDVAIKEDLGL